MSGTQHQHVYQHLNIIHFTAGINSWLAKVTFNISLSRRYRCRSFGGSSGSQAKLYIIVSVIDNIIKTWLLL